MGSSFHIREANLEDAKDIAEVHIETWRASYSDILPSNLLKELSPTEFVERREKSLRNKDLSTFIATNEENKIVGFCIVGPERNHDKNMEGELYAIYLLKEYQRQGIGRQLLMKGVEALQAKQINSMIVWILKENQHQEFYRKLGGKQLEEKKINLGGTDYDEVAYGWEDLSSLLN